MLRGLITGETVDQNLPPGEYPGIAFATRSKGYDAKEIPGFAVVISRRFFCSVDDILHVKRAPRITLNTSFKNILAFFDNYLVVDTYSAEFFPLLSPSTDLIRSWLNIPSAAF